MINLNSQRTSDIHYEILGDVDLRNTWWGPKENSSVSR